jgi:ATP synthase proteolipid subunit
MGCTAAIVFTCLGASYGTAKSGVGIAAMGVLRPDLIVKSTCRKAWQSVGPATRPLEADLTNWITL